MSLNVSQEAIERVRAQADIVEFISEYVPLKKKGADYWGLCPFHEEKTPSFKVSPSRQFFHCFGCGKGGSVFTFLMAHDNLSFSEALRAVAARVGVEIGENRSAWKGADLARERLYKTNAFALQYFRENLGGDVGTKARSYLEERRISSKTVETFALGFALPQWDGLVRAGGTAGFAPAQLAEAGLAKAGERGGFYDRFRDRLMFPILGLNGDIVAFGGRTLAGEDAKYINSSESLVYTKGDNLYGLYLARKQILKASRAILVEGYFDLISLWQAGIENVVASCGTALTHAQAKLMRRYAEEVVLLYDSDEAGLKASERAAEILISVGMRIKVATLPGGADPDEFVRKAGASELMKHVAESTDFLDFFVNQREKHGLLANVEHRVSAARQLAEIIKHAPDELIKDAYLKFISEKLSVDEALLRKETVLKEKRTIKEKTSEPSSQKIPVGEKRLIRILVTNPDSLQAIRHDFPPDCLRSELGRQILTKLYDLPRETVETCEIIEGLGSTEAGNALAEIMAEKHPASEADYFEEVVESFLRNRRKAEVKKSSQRVKAAEQSGDEQRVMELLKQQFQLRRSAEDKT